MTTAAITLGIAAACFLLLILWRENERREMRAQIRELEAVVRLKDFAIGMADASKADLIDDVVDAWQSASEAFDRAAFMDLRHSELRAASRVLPSLDDPADLYVSEAS